MVNEDGSTEFENAPEWSPTLAARIIREHGMVAHIMVSPYCVSASEPDYPEGAEYLYSWTDLRAWLGY